MFLRFACMFDFGGVKLKLQICLDLACFQIGAPDSQDQRLDDVFSKLHALYLYCWCLWLLFVSILALACLSSLTLVKVLRFRSLSSLQRTKRSGSPVLKLRFSVSICMRLFTMGGAWFVVSSSKNRLEYLRYVT
ncbi:hypothetical protein YC2023_016411 [Brassica napus]